MNVVNTVFFCRYTGDKDTQVVNNDQSQAEQILQQLHKQAELRQQEREAVSSRKRKSSDIAGKESVYNNHYPAYIVFINNNKCDGHFVVISTVYRYLVIEP